MHVYQDIKEITIITNVKNQIKSQKSTNQILSKTKLYAV